MKITVLVENTVCCDGLAAQHGLSLYLETNGRKILFDMGRDDTFVKNAENLGIDLSKVDFAVLSHGHYDHGGGLAHFLRINQTAPVYLHAQAFGSYFNGTEKFIGLDKTLEHHDRLIPVCDDLQLPWGMKLTDCNSLGWHVNSWGLNRKNGQIFQPDDFCHEQYLQITEGDRRYLISGCSHKGIENIVSHFQPDVLVGGFHINKMEDTAAIEAMAKRLLSYPTVYYTGHCTGLKQFGILKACMGKSLQALSTGKIFEA